MLCFFNLAGAIHDPDVEGIEMESLAAAREAAVRAIADCIRDQPEVIWSGQELRMEVTDSSQLIVSTVIVFGIDSPATANAKP